MSNYFFVNIMMTASIFSFLLMSNHYLNLLLSVEFMMLTLLVFLSAQNQSNSKEISIMFLFLCMMIMEGIFGLALLLMSSQYYGKDFFLVTK